MEIVVATDRNYSNPNPVYAFDAGLNLLPGFPAGAYPTFNGSAGAVEPPVLADLSNDAGLEIAQVCSPNNLNDVNYGKIVLEVIDASGRTLPGWPRILGSYAESADAPPAVGDLDGDGANEIVIASREGTIRLFRHDGTEISSWQIGANITTVYAPVLADFDGDGRLSIVVKYDNNSTITIAVFDASGALRAGWPRSFPGVPMMGLVTGDLDGDGVPEVVFVSGSGWNDVHALRADGAPLANWPVHFTFPLASSGTTPIVADADGNGSMDVLVVGKGGMSAFDADGAAVPGFPKYTTPGSEVRSTAAVGDLDGDGLVTIALKSEEGRLYAWKPAASVPIPAAWPMYRHDPLHTGSGKSARPAARNRCHRRAGWQHLALGRRRRALRVRPETSSRPMPDTT